MYLRTFAFLLIYVNLLHWTNATKDVHPRLPVTLFKDLNQVNELHVNYWTTQAQDVLKFKIKDQLNNKVVKNVILFLGDGMSMSTVTATRAFVNDTSFKLSFEAFPYFGLSKTYCVDSKVADSACSSTAYLSGVKGNKGTIGVTAEVPRRNCTAALDTKTHTESIAAWAQKAKKATGFVTTTRVTHASPAGLYAHTANRDWENDNEVLKDGCDPEKNEDIAHQLVHSQVGKNFRVILGGGRGEFRSEDSRDEEGKTGYRADGRDLIEEWLMLRRFDGPASYVWNRTGLLQVETSRTDYLLGLFSKSHCAFHGDLNREDLRKTQPSLTVMTETAIRMLRKDDNGYFLFVEGGRIDMAHHETRPKKALEDTEEFARAIEMAREMTSEEDTLIVVTADHSHTMTLNGYPKRRSDILGLSDKIADGDNLPYEILSYANGPGYKNTYKTEGGGRRDLSSDNFADAEYEHTATAPLDSETHAGEDVGVFASGPQAHLFVGNYEQNNIPLLMAYASKIGPYLEKQNENDGASVMRVQITLLSLLVTVTLNL